MESMQLKGGEVKVMARVSEEGNMEVSTSCGSCEDTQEDVTTEFIMCCGVCDGYCSMTESEQSYDLNLEALSAAFMNRIGSRLERSTFKSKTSSL
jgi:hypothetical protein